MLLVLKAFKNNILKTEEFGCKHHLSFSSTKTQPRLETFLDFLQ